jgi:hypothetical protein
MKFRNTVIALVLLVLVGGYAYYTALHKSTSQGQRMFKVEAKDIARIDLRYPNNREIVLELGPHDRWTITKPLKVSADQAAADDLARSVAGLETTKTVAEEPKDLALFGLKPPRATITVSLKDKKELPAIYVGKATPIGFSTYVRLAGKPAVMITSSTFGTKMTKEVDDLRDRQLLPPVDAADKVVIEHRPGETIELAKKDGDWSIVKPASYRADANVVTGLLSNLTNGRISRFVSDSPSNLAEYGLEQPTLNVSVSIGKGPPQSLAFGKQTSSGGEQDYYVKRADSQSVYTVPDWIFKEVNKTVTDLRDKTVLTFDPSNVGLVRVENNGQKFTLKLDKKDKWQIENGTAGPADAGAVIQLLSSLRNLKGVSIVADPLQDPQQFGLEHPIEEFDLNDTSGKSLGWVKLGRVAEPALSVGGATPSPSPTPPTYQYYASSSATQAAFRIETFNYDDLNKTAEELKAKPAAESSPKK